MSDLNEKLAPAEARSDDVARMRLKFLRSRWGVAEAENWAKVELVLVKRDDLTEVWKRESGTGDDAMFALSERRPHTS